MNRESLTTICPALCSILGVEKPEFADKPNEYLLDYAREAFHGEKADRLLIMNPDAISQWVMEKYPEFVAEVDEVTELKLPIRTMSPSVTPVCFSSMYTGATPDVTGNHEDGVRNLVTIDTFFDALPRQGKKVALLTRGFKGTMNTIFNGRPIDYFHCESMAASIAKAMELILRDEHDVIILYNANYDSSVHKCGTESPKTLAELRTNSYTFATLCAMAKEHWTGHNTLACFMMDHGSHDVGDGTGTHGLDIDEDMNIMHKFVAFPKGE